MMIYEGKTFSVLREWEENDHHCALIYDRKDGLFTVICPKDPIIAFSPIIDRLSKLIEKEIDPIRLSVYREILDYTNELVKFNISVEAKKEYEKNS